MSTPAPVVLSQDPVVALGAALLAFLVSKYILSAATPAEQLAKAQLLLNIDTALEELNSGSPAGVKDLQTAVSNLVAQVKDPSAALALNELLAVLDTELAALESTVIGKLSGVTANLILSQVAAVAQYYVTQLTPAPSV